MAIISVQGVGISFGPRKLFEGVSFSLEASDRLGIVGPNGCGKSTLLGILLGRTAPDEGSVYIAGGASVGILAQDDAFEVTESAGPTALDQMYAAFPELLAAERRMEELRIWLEEHPGEAGTAAHDSATKEFSDLEERYTSGGGHEFRSRCRSVLIKMGFDGSAMSAPVSRLSGGERTRLALSRQLCREPDILMLDEPTNHLDVDTMGWLENYLASYGKCIITVSHDRFFLDRVTNRTLLMEHGRAKLYKGGWTRSAEQRRTDREIYEKHYRDQQKEIARQEAYIEQQRRWNRERNIIAAESRLKLLDKMEKLKAPEADERTVRMRFSRGIPSGNEVFTVRGLRFAYPGGQELIRGADFMIKKGERVFIVGPNGCGKSTLVRLLLGAIRPTGGAIDPGHNLRTGYYDQQNQNLDPEKTVLSEIWDTYPSMGETEIRSALAAFLFRGDDITRLVSVLSGGERARLTLVRLMLSEMNTLLLDEPTNHLDIGSREALEAALREFDGTLVCVSHDRAFINSLATRLLGFDGSGGLHSIPVPDGGSAWDVWTAARQGFAGPDEKAPDGAEGAPAAQRAAGSNREEYLRRRKETADARRAASRTARLKEEQARLEARIDELNGELAGEAATDYIRVVGITSEIEEAEERLLEIYGELDAAQAAAGRATD
jgi:ATP-binding cassette subfamily F protein 3